MSGAISRKKRSTISIRARTLLMFQDAIFMSSAVSQGSKLPQGGVSLGHSCRASPSARDIFIKFLTAKIAWVTSLVSGESQTEPRKMNFQRSVCSMNVAALSADACGMISARRTD
jgi:hypothetical protein